MKFIRPEKPHFFKPILAGFKIGIRIPTTFSRYLRGTEETYPEEALLKKNGKEWRVNVINEHFAGGGWRRFAEENDLKSGDFIVFEHQGDMVFNAMIFDPITQCRIEPLRALTSTKQEFEVKKEVLSDSEEEEKVPDEGILNLPSYFISTLKPHNINSGSYLRIPARFARSSGLVNRNCEITVKDDKEKSWYMNLKSNEGETRIRQGSKMGEFFTANGFKEGDSFKFELVAIGNGDHESPIVKITPHLATIEPANQKMEVNVSESENDEYPYFTQTIKQYSIIYKCLNIPMGFARSNGFLGKQEMILIDKGGRTWRVKLGSDYCHFRITHGWTEFRDDNGIKEGDAFKFEIVENGAVPVVRFTVMVPGSVGSC